MDRKPTNLTAVTFFWSSPIFGPKKGDTFKIPPRVPPSLATPLPNKYQTRPWLSAERGQSNGNFQRLMNELWIGDPQAFLNFLRMEPAMFDKLVQRVGPRITKTDTHMSKAPSPGLKIAITVRYLA